MSDIENLIRYQKNFDICVGDYVIYHSSQNGANDFKRYKNTTNKVIWEVLEKVEDNQFQIASIVTRNEFTTHKKNLFPVETALPIFEDYISPAAKNKYKEIISAKEQEHEYEYGCTYSKGDIVNDRVKSSDINKKRGFKMKVKDIMYSNTNAAKSGALITAGKTLNKVIKDNIRSSVPRKYRGLLDHAVADIVVANIASFAVKNFISGNYKAKVATDAMMDAAMVEFFSTFNIDKMVTDLLASVNINGLIDEV